MTDAERHRSRPKALKARLAAGDKLLGCFLNSASPIVAELMALAGYDCLMIDAEHSPVGLETALAMASAIKAGGAATLMRVPANDPTYIKRALDIGVDGIMAPAVNSAAEAKALVAACRYPPGGTRGVAVPIIRASGYGLDAEYAKRADDALLVIAQIETAAAVAEAERIAAVPGIDLVFIGPFDLSASLGHLGEPDHPDAMAAIARTETAVRGRDKWLGAIPTAVRPADRLFAEGYRLVLAGADLMLLREAARAQVERYKPAPSLI